MTSRVSGSETSCSFKQSAKAPSPMVVTPNGIKILLRLVLYSNGTPPLSLAVGVELNRNR